MFAGSEKPAGSTQPDQQGDLTMNITRRHSLATLAVLAAIGAVATVDATAAGSYQGSQGHKHRRPPSDQISTVCVPGASDFDPVQCHKDITSNAPKPN
jgi:hypothetical protein